MQLYKAQYIYPVSAPPITHGMVAVDGERIVEVGPAADMARRYAGAPVTDLGASMLMPQAVNAHTHLELTALAEMGRAYVADRSFTRWIVELVKTRRGITNDVLLEGARAGCAMLSASATAVVGDISNRPISVEPLLESGLYGVIYHELIGPDPANAAQLLQSGQEQVRRWRAEYGEQRIRFGITLHTPYTVSAELFRITLPWVLEENIPFCIHVAESPAEAEFLLQGSGEIATILYAPDARAIERMPPAGRSPVRYLYDLGVLKARPLLVHGVQVNRDDLDLLAEYSVPMVHCPRSNFLLNCGRMPIEAYQEAGVPMAIGTDSLGSSPSLSVWEEAISAAATHRAAAVDLDPHELLRLCTLDGARALGFDDTHGSLEPGKLAHLAVGRLQTAHEGEAEKETTAEDMLQALWRGEVSMGPAFSAS
ncbi:MAG: amidohydrolase family protein [Ktedonobacteraceae bacterium]|nr:amidohydrolase family protein [Ktedonobacteraceae bacterium]